jgi:hypothetical protein
MTWQVRSFSWKDKWNLADGPNRAVRRAMEQENKKERDLARRDYVSDIRKLVEFVRGRDPRWTALRIKQKQDEQAKAEQVERTKRDAEMARLAQKQRFQEEVSGLSIFVVDPAYSVSSIVLFMFCKKKIVAFVFGFSFSCK